MKKIYFILSLVCVAFLAASCSSDSMDAAKEQGYLKLDLTTYVSTHTRATDVPNGYDAKKLHVSILDATENIVMESDWTADGGFTNTDLQGTIMLTPGTYTVEAHSANWDGSGSGWNAPFYAGSTNVTVEAGKLKTAKVTCTQDNVTVTVRWDESFPKNFSEASVTVSMPANRDITNRTFYMDETTARSAYFPVGDLRFMLTATSKSGKTKSLPTEFKDVKARDHFIVTYKLAEAGTDKSVDVYVDESTQTYEFTINVNRKPGVSLEAKKIDAWAKFADLSGAITADSYDASGVTLQWKQASATEWITVANNNLVHKGDDYTYRLTNLQPSTGYTYRFAYSDGNGNESLSNEVNFTTDIATDVYNGGFENWYVNKKVWYANEEGTSYWDSSNPGSAGALGESGNVTTRDTNFKHSGESSAKLASMYVNAVIVTKFAAASLYTGKFGKLVGTSGAKLNWGVPFTARPSALKGYMSYSPGIINHGTQPSGVGAPASGTNDYCQIYCALLTEQLAVDNTNMSTFPAWDGSDSRIIAYGSLSQNTSDNGIWKEFNIPLKYYNVTEKPKYLLIVCSSSKYGDYFYGSDTSVLHLDDFEFEYGTPTVQ